MAEEIRITKKLPRKGDDGYRIVSVRMKETLLERLDALSAKSNRSRNELINLLLESAVDIVKLMNEAYKTQPQPLSGAAAAFYSRASTGMYGTFMSMAR